MNEKMSLGRKRKWQSIAQQLEDILDKIFNCGPNPTLEYPYYIWPEIKEILEKMDFRVIVIKSDPQNPIYKIRPNENIKFREGDLEKLVNDIKPAPNNNIEKTKEEAYKRGYKRGFNDGITSSKHFKLPFLI
mgnify:CR=1 FL=1